MQAELSYIYFGLLIFEQADIQFNIGISQVLFAKGV
jgi:hypothetical protein